MRCHHKKISHIFSNLFPAHPSEKLCTPSTSFRGAMYTQYILPRSYVSQTHPFEKLSTPWAYFHHLTCITHKHVVHMRCHHKILIIDFQIYFMHTWFPKYQTINNIEFQKYKSEFTILLLAENHIFLQPWGHPHVVWILQVESTYPLLLHAS